VNTCNREGAARRWLSGVGVCFRSGPRGYELMSVMWRIADLSRAYGDFRVVPNADKTYSPFQYEQIARPVGSYGKRRKLKSRKFYHELSKSTAKSYIACGLLASYQSAICAPVQNFTPLFLLIVSPRGGNISASAARQRCRDAHQCHDARRVGGVGVDGWLAAQALFTLN